MTTPGGIVRTRGAPAGRRQAVACASRNPIPPRTERAVNLSLLRRHLVPSLAGTPEEIAARLSGRDLPVARIVPLAELLRGVVVGRVDAVAQHPNADRLKVCTVSDGGEAPLQIVTGASNVSPGAFYPLIRSGTTLPNGTKIKKGKLRGEVSEGMLGSADELELGTDHAGLLRLPGEPAPGTPLPDVMDTPGVVFVFEGAATEDDVVRALGGTVPEKPAGA
ncbi:MAG: pheT [Gemmatimonadetes bacterium]|nr:pheT [Gemmatimonadota bacterium]